MLVFKQGNSLFNYRVAAVILHEDHLLVHRTENEDFWSLPGGRVEMMETSEVALIREMQEELQETVTIDRLLYIVENFFTWQDNPFHEIGFYFQAHLRPDSPLLQKQQPFYGMEGENLKLIFQWVPLTDLSRYVIKPDFLTPSLRNLSDGIQHIVQREMSSNE